ncbi:MAG: hypothetical protein P8179_15155 [Candidatus Thiodiazotropha sp.]
MFDVYLGYKRFTCFEGIWGELIMVLRSFLFLACAAASSVSSAAIVSYDYSAIGGDDASATIIGTFGYDDTITDSDPSANHGLYTGAGFFSGSVSGGPQDSADFNFSAFDVHVYNDDVVLDDTFEISSDSATLSIVEMYDGTLSAFSNDSLPSVLDFDSFEFVGIRLGQEFGGDTAIDYEITGFTPTPVSAVPVPGAVWLFGSAMLGFVGWSRNKKTA